MCAQSVAILKTHKILWLKAFLQPAAALLWLKLLYYTIKTSEKGFLYHLQIYIFYIPHIQHVDFSIFLVAYKKYREDRIVLYIQ